MLTSPEQIFSLQQELPTPQTEAEIQQMAQVQALHEKIKLLLSLNHNFPESELHVIFELKPSLLGNAHASMIYGSILMVLGEANAQNDLMTELIHLHGPRSPFYLSRSLALARLDRIEEALDDLQVVIAAGVRHYEIYMQAARWKNRLKDFRGAIAMANLAIYENVLEYVEPFVLMAQCFEQCGELNRMFECFSRVEKFQNQAALDREFGDLYGRHRAMYDQVKGMIRS